MANEGASSARAGGAQRGYYAEILLVSFAGLLLEIAYTRVVSFKLFYYFTYLVIGLALLGIGTGGTLVAISRRLRSASTDTILQWAFLLGAASVVLGYIVVALIQVDTLIIWDYGTVDSLTNLGTLLLVCLVLFVPFVIVGIVVATLFARRPDRIGRLYFADLVGAGLACALVVTLLGSIGPPATIMLAGLVMALAGLRVARRGKSFVMPVVIGSVAVLLAVAVAAPGLLPEQRTDPSKLQPDDPRVLFSEWSPLFRVDVIQDSRDLRIVFHDALISSGILRFDGDVDSLDHFESDTRSFPFAVAGEPDNVLIVGAAGGNEVLASLYFGAGHIDAIELDPVTHSLVTDTMADYAGHLAEHPRVNYLQGEGRSFLARSDDTYNIVWFPAPDSYSAANTSGAFVLSESYLYTSDAIERSLGLVEPNGIVVQQYGEVDPDNPVRTPRYAATARRALAEIGVDDPSRHMLVSTTPNGGYAPLFTAITKPTPFTTREVNSFVAALDDVPGSTLLYAPAQDFEPNPVSEVITAPSDELDQLYDSYPRNIRPITDDGPFFWNFTRFDDVLGELGDPIRGDPDERESAYLGDSVGERVLALLLVIAIVFATVFLLLPFAFIRSTWTALPRKGGSALYFTALGVGFIFFEITLMQRLVLFLGYPTYSLTVTLMSILIFTGIGALLSDRWRFEPRRMLLPLAIAITALALFYELGLPPLTDALLGSSLAVRVVVAFAVLAPLGLCLGMFMPLGLGVVSRLSPFSREYVAWGWAVNGFASVVGVALTTILAMTFGFRVVLFLALAAYLIALAVLRRLLRVAPSEPTEGSRSPNLEETGTLVEASRA